MPPIKKPIVRIPPVPVPKPPVDEKEIQAIVDAAIKSLADKMGINPASIPANIKKAIRDAVLTALSTRLNTLIQRDADTAVKDHILVGAKPLDMLDNRVSAARDAIAHIVADSRVNAVLADTANLLYKKFQALRTAGFSETQAFEILLAEIQGGASK
jgi:H2-forming N5,N10-methylenetetrahydromethanopterin dehydrogenase-like enzyme